MSRQAVSTTSRQNLQLVGVTALFIASKYEELYPPEVKDFVYITDDTYTKHDVLQMEKHILKVGSNNAASQHHGPFEFESIEIFQIFIPNTSFLTKSLNWFFQKLKFELGCPISISFLRRFSKVASCDGATHMMAKYFIELIEIEYKMCHFPRSKVSVVQRSSLPVSYYSSPTNSHSWPNPFSHTFRWLPPHYLLRFAWPPPPPNRKWPAPTATALMWTTFGHQHYTITVITNWPIYNRSSIYWFPWWSMHRCPSLPMSTPNMHHPKWIRCQRNRKNVHRCCNRWWPSPSK